MMLSMKSVSNHRMTHRSCMTHPLIWHSVAYSEKAVWFCNKLTYYRWQNTSQGAIQVMAR